jgi:hypothetical protein
MTFHQFAARDLKLGCKVDFLGDETRMRSNGLTVTSIYFVTDLRPSGQVSEDDYMVAAVNSDGVSIVGRIDSFVKV